MTTSVISNTSHSKEFIPNGLPLSTISLPQGLKARLFVESQESTRKDLKKAFGVLQTCFAIIHDQGVMARHLFMFN